MGPFARSEQTDDPSSSGSDGRAVAAQGNIDALRAGRITGWAFATVAGQALPLLEVRIVHESGLVLGSGYATEYRPDVQEAGLATAWCGFALPHVDGVPVDGLVTLQTRVEGVWVLASQVPLEVVPRDGGPVASEEPAEFFADLLSGFASARSTGGIIGKASMRIGEDLWIQAASDVADDTRAALRLEDSGSSGADDRPYIHVERASGPASRVDIRFRILRSVDSGNGLRIAVPVRIAPGQSGSLRLGLYNETGRTAIGTYSPPPGGWVTLESAFPEIETRGTAAVASVWLEVIAAGLSNVDIGAPQVSGVRDSLFECLRVGAQQDVILAVESGNTLANAPEDFSVVIPFYGNRAFTGHCVDAVLANSAHRVHVILVDDGTPVASGEQFLGGLREHVEIVSFDANHGYTSAVNAGVLASRTRKVIVLNNDTRVTPGWDVPLLHALDDETVFAAGPLSNAASYQSVPQQRVEGGWAVNELPAAARPGDLASALRSAFGVESVTWPILNGFCYAVRGADFVDLGMLDAAAFPRGYGEEVDLMLRSVAAGRRNVIAPGSFVYHYKSKTFSGERAGLSAAANVILGERWGDRLAEAIAEMDSAAELGAVRERFVEVLASLAGETSQ